MARRVRVHRLAPTEPLVAAGRSAARPGARDLAARTAAAPRLDLGSRIAYSADVQATAGNAAMAHAVGFARTDHLTQPPGGITEIATAARSPGNRGFTQSRYMANPPISAWGSRARRPALGRSGRPMSGCPRSTTTSTGRPPAAIALGSYGAGSQFLDVTEDWSARSPRARRSM